MPPATTRRKHLKSRKGCLQCKTRKIKCDENGIVPCAQCVKNRRADCSFAESPSDGMKFSRNSMLDMELLHHYTTKTALSLASFNDNSISKYYSIVFVELGLQHDYLLHCILSLSAFHIVRQKGKPNASFSPATSSTGPNTGDVPDEYLMAAHSHYDNALKGFRCSLSALNAETCHAAFACAFLIFITSLARQSEIFQSIQSNPAADVTLWLDNQLSEWSILSGGLPVLFKNPEISSALWQGPVAPLISYRYRASPAEKSDSSTILMALTRLQTLSDAIRAMTPDDKIVGICLESIKSLEKIFADTRPSMNIVVAILWSSSLDPKFLCLLGERRSEALLVFAYYCVLLLYSSSRWYMKRWPQSIIEAIKYSLDDKWMPLLDWPLLTASDYQEDTAY